MRFLFVLISFFLSVTLAQQEVVGERVRVIFDDPALEAYALQVAEDAERALAVLVPIFGLPSDYISIAIEENTDVYNAFATLLPRPSVRLRTLFPNAGFIGFGAESDLYLLLVHELTHSTQLGYTGTEPGLKLGIVGQDAATVPPGWFVEGIAVWAESEYTAGGRRNDPVTNGLLATLALSEDFPTLTEVSLDTFSDWPGGLARYILGVRFTDYLIQQHGFDAVLLTLKQYNTGLLPQTFADAWETSVGTSLFDTWDSFQASEVARAEARQTSGETLLTDSGWYTGSPSFSPDGSRLAWVSWPPAIVVADWSRGLVENEGVTFDTLLADTSVDSLDWLDNDTLVFSRNYRQPGHTYKELFTLDVITKEVTRLTDGARAQFPRATPEGCVLFVRDFEPVGSSLQKYCDGQTELFWQAPADTHIVGLDVSAGGRVVLSLWDAGRVELFLLEHGQHITLTGEAVDLDPVWRGDFEIIFRSSRNGDVFDLYRLTLAPEKLTALTRTPGGAFSPAPHPDGGVAYASLGEDGYNLAWLGPDASAEVSTLSTVMSAAERAATTPVFTVRPYSPLASLAPYGWLPSYFGASLSPLGLGLGASLYGQDDSGEHSYSVTAGYDTRLPGYAAGAFANVTYGYRQSTGVLPGSNYPWGVSVRAGLFPHAGHLDARTEVVAGLEFSVRSQLPLDRWILYAGARASLLALPSYGMQPEATANVTLSQRRADRWGYTTRGPRYGVTAVLGATPAGSSPGVWGDASYYAPFGQFGVAGTAELALRAGYRQAPQVPLALQDFAAVGTAGYRVSLPAELRYGDGLFALERLTLEPRLRGWLNGSAGVGGDLSINLDTVLNYRAPLAVGATVGYAQGFWYRFGVRLTL